MKRYLPIELDVEGREVALVGDHLETRRKLDRLRDAGARVVLYDAGRELEAPAPEWVVLRSGFPENYRRFCAVFAAPALADALAAEATRAREEGRLFCILDRPEHSTFANPAVLDAGGIGVRLFGGGAAPGLTRRLREELERALDTPAMQSLVRALAEMRRSWPRSERPERTREALRGFGLDVRLRLPAWVSGRVPQGGTNPSDVDNS